jgi:hypothetical protein
MRAGSRQPVAQSGRKSQRLRVADAVRVSRLVAMPEEHFSHRGADRFYADGWAQGIRQESFKSPVVPYALSATTTDLGA